jgi:hypothetical protein
VPYFLQNTNLYSNGVFSSFASKLLPILPNLVSLSDGCDGGNG